MEKYIARSRMNAGVTLDSGQVHIYRVNLDLHSEKLERLLDILSREELDRVRRFHFKKDQNRFIAARGTLRRILGKYLDIKPQQIRFDYNAYGKPILLNKTDSEILKFNLSHSDQYALYGFAKKVNIGIDIERIRFDLEVDQIGKRFFSQAEMEVLKAVDGKTRHRLFFQYWTRKEAVIKAEGRGISLPLEEIDVSKIRESGTLSYSLAESKNNDNSQWFVRDLIPYPGYVAAIAIEESKFDINFWSYQH